MDAQAAHSEGRLTARPGRRLTQEAPAPGLQALGLAASRDALLYVPLGHRAGLPAPFALMLHGAGGSAEQALVPLRPWADEAGLVLLAPQSRGPTWDLVLDDFGPDVGFIDAALAHVFARLQVDPERLAVAGFSDGASYALSLGLGNGDLFTHVLAFSPGFMAPALRVGSPGLYLSHGTRDAVLPIDSCSRRLVASLEAEGYALQYAEFDGPHTVPPARAREALALLLDARSAAGQASS